MNSVNQGFNFCYNVGTKPRQLF